MTRPDRDRTPSGRRTARLADVAAEAGLSPAAVSRYLNGRLDLPQVTRDRVDGAILKLGYRPNALAKRLSTGRSETIAIVMPDIANPFFAELAGGIEAEARDHGLGVQLSLTGGDRTREIEALRALSDSTVEGLILSTNRPDDGTLRRLLGRHPQMVLVDEAIAGVDVPRVFAENAVGGRMAARHLIAAGHRRIAHIGGPPGLMSVRERLEGFTAALSEAGLHPHAVRLAEYSRAHGLSAGIDLLSGPDRPTAIMAASDYIAVGVIEAARQLGLSIPGDVSLVGFDDISFARLVNPPLTTVRQPIADLGRLAMRRLADLIAGRTPPRETRLPVQLVERHSVASPTREMP